MPGMGDGVVTCPMSGLSAAYTECFYNPDVPFLPDIFGKFSLPYAGRHQNIKEFTAKYN